MQKKGINTLIEETKQSMTHLVNTFLKQGAPITDIDLVLQNLCFEVKDTAKDVISKEIEQAQNQYKAEHKLCRNRSNMFLMNLPKKQII